MGARFPSVQSNTILNSPIVTTAETVICTLPPFNPTLDGVAIFILALVVLVTAAGSTSITLRLRRGTLVTGALIQTSAFAEVVTAAASVSKMLWYFDTPGAVGGQQYSLTAQIAAAAANSTVNDVAMLAFAL